MKIKQGIFVSWLYRQLNLFNEQRHLYSIRTAFISTMPIVIVGAYAIVISQLPINSYQKLMDYLFGENWRLFGSLAFNSTTQLVTLMVIFLTCSNLAKWYNTNRHKQADSGICGIVGLTCYMVLSLPIEQASFLSFNIVGVNGLFTALLVSVVAGEAMVRLSSRKNNIHLLSNAPNLAVPQSFSSIMPATIVIGGFLLLRIALVMLGFRDGFTDMINNFLYDSYRYSSNLIITAVRYNISTHLIWVLGIHGNNVLDGVAQTVFVPAMHVNIAAVIAGLAPINLITKTLFDVFVYMGGSGTTLGLLIALFIFGRRRDQHPLLRYSLPNAIFNINEPLVFGIPIVLNPFYSIPFILTPVIMLFTTVFAMSLGLVPYTIAQVSWATPILISGYIATGSIAGTILQLINLVLAVLIYAPFVRLSEKMTMMHFQQAYLELLEVIFSTSAPPCQKLIDRMDTVGAVARKLSNQLDTAMENNEMFLNYQPIVDAHRNKLHSVEALLRWFHPENGLINPMAIITLAEEANYISKLGLWILEEAISQRAQWTQDGLEDFHVSVNVSTKQLNTSTFHSQVLSILNKYKVPSSQLQIEITETAALEENTMTNKNLRILSQAGVTIAMDDFGVGHSSLLYLRTQPISTLKIDGSLSRDIIQNPSNLDIITTIHDLCNILNVNTIVEYVSSQDQLNQLMDIGISLVQGYFYSPPLAANNIPDFIKGLSEE